MLRPAINDLINEGIWGYNPYKWSYNPWAITAHDGLAKVNITVFRAMVVVAVRDACSCLEDIGPPLRESGFGGDQGGGTFQPMYT